MMQKRLFKRSQIYARWLRIHYDKPYTIFLACLFPFLQAFSTFCIVIYADPDFNSFQDYLYLFLCAGLFYFSFVMNSKRAAQGTWLGIFLLIIFGSFGVVAGKLFSVYILS